MNRVPAGTPELSSDLAAKGNHYHHRLMDYNNDPNARFADIQRIFFLLEQRIQKQIDAERHAR